MDEGGGGGGMVEGGEFEKVQDGVSSICVYTLKSKQIYEALTLKRSFYYNVKEINIIFLKSLFQICVDLLK